MNFYTMEINIKLSTEAHQWLYRHELQGVAGTPDHNNKLEVIPGPMEFMAWLTQGSRDKVSFHFQSTPDIAMMFKLAFGGR